MKRLGTGIALLALALATVGCGMISTGESAGEKASDIATFDIPAGFTPEVGMELAGVAMVGYVGSDENNRIFLIQAPESSNMSQEQLEQSLHDALDSAGGGPGETVDAEEVPVTIRGQQVTATTGTGTGANNVAVRVMTVPFTGAGGPALLFIEMPEADWDQAVVDDFIASFQ